MSRSDRQALFFLPGGITIQVWISFFVSRNLRRFPREDHTSFEDDVADPVLASYSTSELIRILDLIDKIQNAQRAEARSDVELTSEEARTLRHLMNAYVKWEREKRV